MKIFDAFSLKMSLMALLPATLLKSSRFRPEEEYDPLLPFPELWSKHR